MWPFLIALSNRRSSLTTRSWEGPEDLAPRGTWQGKMKVAKRHLGLALQHHESNGLGEVAGLCVLTLSFGIQVLQTLCWPSTPHP